MNNDELKKYNEGRQKIIKEYRKKKLINVTLIFTAAIAAIALIWLLFSRNIAVTLVLTAMTVMITIIFARIRIVTLNHTAQTRLRFHEQNEPIFHAEFKKK